MRFETNVSTKVFNVIAAGAIAAALYISYKLVKNEIEVAKEEEIRKKELEKFVSQPVRLNVEEVKKPELSAKLVAENIGFQLGKRMNFRRAVKMACQSTMAAGAKGVRIEVAGRLNGAEMSRREKFIEGSVPLHTLRADIDFYIHHAPTIAGIVGVKVWIYKGEK